MGEAHAAVVALRVALADNALVDPADDASRPWPDLAAMLHRVNTELRRPPITPVWVFGGHRTRGSTRPGSVEGPLYPGRPPAISEIGAN